MRNKALMQMLAASALLLPAAAALAHEPVAKCVLLDESTVRCRGVSNDGDEFADARMEVFALDGQLLHEGKLGKDATMTFTKPQQAFYVLFDTGPGLQVTVEQEEILPRPAGRVPSWMRTP